MDNDSASTEENAARCRCPDCPAYNECMKNKREFFSAHEVVLNAKLIKGDVYVYIVPMK